MTTWAKELDQALKDAGDKGESLACTLSDLELRVEFDGGSGCTEGAPFLAWTATRVYFPVCYDGAEWVGSAPREPQAAGQEHVGDG